MKGGAVTFVSQLTLTTKFIKEMSKATVSAACMHVTRMAKIEARGGFKSGTFVTRGWQSISWYLVPADMGMSYRGFVGSSEKHFMFWEMGHHNIFTRQYEQNRWLTRAMRAKRIILAQEVKLAAQVVAARYSLLTKSAAGFGKVTIMKAPKIGPKGVLPG